MSGVSFRAQVGDQTRYIFRVQNPNIVLAVFSGLERQDAPSRVIEDYRHQVADGPGFDRQKPCMQSAPRARLAGLREEDVKTLVQVNQKLAEQWRESISD